MAACSGDGRSTISPSVAPERTATTMARTVPPASTVPRTAPLSSATATATVPERLAAQLGSVTVPALPEEGSEEVGGLQNTASNLGMPFRTTLAGGRRLGGRGRRRASGGPGSP
jgi:hypothetical protein